MSSGEWLARWISARRHGAGGSGAGIGQAVITEDVADVAATGHNWHEATTSRMNPARNAVMVAAQATWNMPSTRIWRPRDFWFCDGRDRTTAKASRSRAEAVVRSRCSPTALQARCSEMSLALIRSRRHLSPQVLGVRPADGAPGETDPCRLIG